MLGDARVPEDRLQELVLELARLYLAVVFYGRPRVPVRGLLLEHLRLDLLELLARLDQVDHLQQLAGHEALLREEVGLAQVVDVLLARVQVAVCVHVDELGRHLRREGRDLLRHLEAAEDLQQRVGLDRDDEAEVGLLDALGEQLLHRVPVALDQLFHVVQDEERPLLQDLLVCVCHFVVADQPALQQVHSVGPAQSVDVDVPEVRELVSLLHVVCEELGDGSLARLLFSDQVDHSLLLFEEPLIQAVQQLVLADQDD